MKDKIILRLLNPMLLPIARLIPLSTMTTLCQMKRKNSSLMYSYLESILKSKRKRRHRSIFILTNSITSSKETKENKLSNF